MNYSAEQINNAFSKLSPEQNRAIYETNIDNKISEIIKKYNLTPEEGEVIDLYVTYVIVNLLKKEDFSKTILEELKLSPEISKNIFLDVDENIFVYFTKKLQRIEEENYFLQQNSSPNLDSRFRGLPSEVQNAIAKTEWKEALNKIFNDYKLNIEQMGVLEDLTVKVINNEIHSDHFENEVSSKILIPKTDIAPLIKDVNDSILIKIREAMKNKPITEIKNENEIPIPPYAQKNIVEEVVPTPLYEKPITVDNTLINKEVMEIKKEASGNLITNDKLPSEIKSENQEDLNTSNFEDSDSVFANKASNNILEDKLKNATVSEHGVSDYSMPKITKTESVSSPTIKSHDPYREEF